jgi:hypothetical protein
MSDVTKLIRSAFECDHIPTRDELVKFDGFDTLEKEYAIKTFLGKNRDEVAKLIKQREMGTMSDVEGLSVMEPYGFRYYFPVYLYHVLSVQNPDDGETSYRKTRSSGTKC